MEHDEDYLCHHGVKGMKWGVRKDRRGGLPSSRKIRKQIKKANKNPENNKNTIAIQKKIKKKILSSEEAKNYKKLEDSIFKSAPSNARYIQLDKTTSSELNKMAKAYQDKANSIYTKMKDDLAGAVLKDLGYKDTSDGREYLKKKKII